MVVLGQEEKWLGIAEMWDLNGKYNFYHKVEQSPQELGAMVGRGGALLLACRQQE